MNKKERPFIVTSEYFEEPIEITGKSILDVEDKIDRSILGGGICILDPFICTITDKETGKYRTFQVYNTYNKKIIKEGKK